MKGFIKEYFNYSQREFKGLVVLIVLIVLVFVWPLVAQYLKSDNVTDFELFKLQITEFETRIEENGKEEISISYFVFDPNTVSRNDLINLGLRNSQAQTLINYRNSGGVFKRPPDLKKIYKIDADLYKRLEPYIRIKKTIKPLAVNSPSSSPNKSKKEHRVVCKEIKPVELNSADSVDLIKLYGIGPVLSRRIINYREQLGGYVNKSQLLEVYGLEIDTYGLIESDVTVDADDIVKIDINKASFKILANHPYISYANTKSIMKYRELMSRFNAIDELLENHLMDSLVYSRAKYYIKIGG